MEKAISTSNLASQVTYSVSGVLTVFGMSLNDIALILGILLGVATFLINWYYKHKTYQYHLKEMDDDD
jgi:hypothetical protein